MLEFFRALPDSPLLVNGLLAGLLASVACGIIGSYVVAKRIVFISGAIAHVVVGGLGAAIFLRYHFAPALDWLTPMHGAMLSALAAAIVIGLVHQRISERMDTLIGAMWAAGMATGLMLIHYTPGYEPELISYLFGSISSVSREDLVQVAVLDGVIVVVVGLFHRQLLAVSLDEEYALLQGVRVQAINLLLLGLIALATVVLIHLVGVILLIALLTLPAAIAGHYVGRLGSIMVVATVVCAVLTTAGRALAYPADAPAGPTIILLAATLYILSVAIARLRARRRTRQRARLDHTSPVP